MTFTNMNIIKLGRIICEKNKISFKINKNDHFQILNRYVEIFLTVTDDAKGSLEEDEE